jgi:bifunctional DNA-binding transcriptional regulator/antitoxin component of YhaV-PrlF toxin-antitoxin module
MSSAVAVRKIFDNGQVTLPKFWRERIKTNKVSIYEHEDELRIKPHPRNRTYELPKSSRENVLFDSAKCGYPEGIEINQFLKLLKKARCNG